jgi:hypothetical protein
VIRRLFVIHVPDASDMGAMAIFLGPVDRFLLGLESPEDMISMVLDHIIADRIAFMAALRPGLDKNPRHSFPPSQDPVAVERLRRRAG